MFIPRLKTSSIQSIISNYIYHDLSVFKANELNLINQMTESLDVRNDVKMGLFTGLAGAGLCLLSMLCNDYSWMYLL